jgi:adenosylmethionine-8-amino-7-oxononanoate aminotransferase
MDTKTLDKKYLSRNESPDDIILATTEGSYLTDVDGKRYIDLTSGWCVGNLGWGNNELRRAIQNYEGPDYVYPGLFYKPWVELAELLASIAPEKLIKCYRATSGTEALEIAMQLAMAYTGRTKFLSIENSYHGNSIATLSIGASSNKDKIKGLLPNCHKVDLPLTEKTLKKIETHLKQKNVAAFIMEPVICNIGVYIPSQEFMAGLNALCKRYNTLLVMDEVATGFWRTGKFFASEHYKIDPDIVCLSKAVTGGYAGLGATLTTEKIANKVKGKLDIYSTYGWHPLSVEVAITNIKFMLKHKTELIHHLVQASQHFRTGLSQIIFKGGSKLNIIGLAISVELESAAYAEKIRKKCLKKGLLFTVQEKHLVLFPPLTIREKTINKALAILDQCI